MSRSHRSYESTAALAGRRDVNINAVLQARNPSEVRFDDVTSTVTVEGKNYHFPRWIFLILMLSMAGCFQQAGDVYEPTSTSENASTATETRAIDTPSPTADFNELFAQATQSALENRVGLATVVAGATQSALETRQVLVNDAQHVLASETPTATQDGRIATLLALATDLQGTQSAQNADHSVDSALTDGETATPTPEVLRPQTVSQQREAPVVPENTVWAGVDFDAAHHSAEIAPEVVRFIQDEFFNPDAEQDNTFITNLTNPHGEDLTTGNDRVTPNHKDERGLGFTDAAIDQLSTVTGEARLQMPIESVFVSNGAGTGEVTTFSIGAAHDHQFSSLISAAGMVFELHKEAILTSIAGVPEFQDGLTVEEFLTDPRFQSFRSEINGTRAELEAEYICEVLPLSEGEQFRRETTDTDIAFDGSNWMIENGYSPSSDQWTASIVSNEPVRGDVSREDQVQTLRGVVFRDKNDDPESTGYFATQDLGDQTTFTPIAWGATLDIDGPGKGAWDLDAFSAGVLISPDGTTSITGENFAAMLNEIQRCGRRGEVASTVTPTETVIAPTGERSTDVAPSDTPVFTSTVVIPTETPTHTRTIVPASITPTSAPTNTHEFTRVPSQTATRGVTPTDVPVVEPTETPSPTHTRTIVPATITPTSSLTNTHEYTRVPTQTATRVEPSNTPTRVTPSETPRPSDTPIPTVTNEPTEVLPTPTFAPTNTDVFPTLPPVEPTRGVTPTDIPIDG